ncbi:9578_t:CDS:2 [Funneliformis mosseae]|uniref:9578_t:CDS:1 n=1 Tax=Funneliformis mosseae TaxID=27381 RepID=A0A9N8WF25_FUNMO|nr:9578_t:CDS:2 [Funneliformis mosseae]
MRLGIGGLTASIAGLQLQEDKEIWICYNDEHISIKQSSLEDLTVSNIISLKMIIKVQYKISENVTICSGDDNLKNSKLVIELYNTEDNALEIIVEDNKSEEQKEEDESNFETNRIEEVFN